MIPFYILKLTQITPELVLDNQLAVDRGEKLDEVVEKIKKYFQFTGLDGIIKNIREKAEESEQGNSDLMMILTDSPLLSLVQGKFPLGSGSCQNYETGSFRENLLGYVGDTHCKVLYALDMKKLPKELITLIRTQGIDNIEFEKHTTEILEAVVGRSVIKLGIDKDSSKPVAFIEPVYTSANKSNHSLDQAIYDFMLEIFNNESGFITGTGPLFHPSRGTTPISVIIAASDNSYGQYEDTGALGVSRGEYLIEGRM